MPAISPGSSNKDALYYRVAGTKDSPTPIIGQYYGADAIKMVKPESVEITDETGKKVKIDGKDRYGRNAIFNRYSVFYFNSLAGHADKHEPYFDKDRKDVINKTLALQGTANTLADVVKFPTAANIVLWSKQGTEGSNNAVEYAWEDFLWCKNFGIVPNNYMVTLRRFTIPVTDDLLDRKKQPAPDVGRLICWVDGESNTWENVGLKFSTSLTWQKLESEIQSVQAQPGWGNEGGALPGILGNVVKAFSSVSQPGHGAAMLGYNEKTAGIDPYANKNVVFGPLDVIKEMMVRDKGLQFEQAFTLKFEYELRSIDGINPKIAFLDLLSNVLVVTANRGGWWGGEIRYYGGNPRQIKPLGKPELLANGDYGGYLKSLVSGIQDRVSSLTNGAGLSLEGIGNAMKNIGGGLMDNIMGGALDKMGRPGAQALNALLSGEDTGEWHVMVGNPANPIMSVGNLILEKTEIAFSGALGPDDFPSKLEVVCTLKPARPRDRSDIMSMFHRNGRTYLTVPPGPDRYAANRPKGGQNGGKTPPGDKDANFEKWLKNKDNSEALGQRGEARFPNHGVTDSSIDIQLLQAAQGIF